MSLKIEKKRLKEIDIGKEIFEIGPIYRGFGMRLGGLIRSSLFNIEGYAVERVVLEKGYNEFSHIKGWENSLMQFILKLGKICIWGIAGKQIVGLINKQGPCNIYASDIYIDDKMGCKIYNTTLLLGKICDSSIFQCYIIFGWGKGYRRRVSGRVSNIINVDSYYCPINSVGYNSRCVKEGFDILSINISANRALDMGKMLKRVCRRISRMLAC
ncbi:hypothetical protein [Candidatus Vidania fulgoroideorum]